MNMLIPNSDSLPLPADNVHEAFPPAKKKAAPVPPDEEPEPVEDDDDEFADDDEDAEFADDEDEEPVEDDDDEPVEDEEEPEQSATVKVTVTAAPDRPAAPAKAPAPKKAAPPPLPKKKKPSRPARGFTEADAEMDALVEAYIRPLREYTTKSGKRVEIHSEKWHRCTEKVKARGDVDNAYAVCTASLGASKSLKKGHGGSA